MPKVEHLDATVLSDDELRTLDAHWRAANYLAAGQIYLLANPLLTEPLRPEKSSPHSCCAGTCHSSPSASSTSWT